MKKIIICLCLLFSLGCVKAEEIEIKNKNLYIFDESVQVDGAYDGIGFIAGSNVNVKSILEYGALAGADVYFNGNINKDLFTFGASVDISGSIGRDAYIAGTSVKINGNINGNLYVYASELIIGEEAIINGNVKFYGETFKTKGGSIGGTLSYYETGQRWQLTGLSYHRMNPDYEGSMKLLDKNVEVTAHTITSDALSSTPDKDGIIPGDDIQSVYVKIEDLYVYDVYTTQSNITTSNGAMTLYCKDTNGVEVIIRTSVLKDAEGNMVIEADVLNKTISPTGIVTKYEGKVQIHVYTLNELAIA